MAAAYELHTRGVRYTLIEAASRLGGKIVTDHRAGFIIEGGPDSFLTQKPWALELCRELGLQDRLMPTNDEQREVYVLSDGTLHPLPDGVMLVVPTKFWPFVTSPLLSWTGKLRMGMDLFIPPRTEEGDESLASFVRRRLGEEALVKIAEPLMAGIHSADAEKLSLQATFPRFARIEQKYGSLIRGMLAARARRDAGAGRPTSQSTPFVTLQGGTAKLVDALEARLEASALCLGRRAVQVDRTRGGRYIVRLGDGAEVQADAVILATPAPMTATLVADLNPALAAGLRTIRYVSTATISLGYRRSDVDHPLNGFGFLVPGREGRRISACTWVTTKFDARAPEDHVLLRVFVGGAGREDYVELDDAEMREMVQEELDDVMGLTAAPVLTAIYRWPEGRPQYDVGHLERVDELERACDPGLLLAGSAYRGAGLPDCIRSGREAARRAFNDYQFRKAGSHLFHSDPDSGY